MRCCGRSVSEMHGVICTEPRDFTMNGGMDNGRKDD